MDPSFFVAFALWFMILPSLYLLGSFFEKWLRDEGLLISGIIYVGLGFGLLAYYVILTGYLKVMNPYALIVLFTVLLIFRGRKIKEFLDWFLSLFKEILYKKETRSEQIWQALLVFSLLITFLTCFLPEISSDALAHHLAIPKRYLQMGQVAPVPYDFKSYQSVLWNSLYVIGLMFKSVPTAKLFHWWSGVFTVFLLVLFINQVTRKKSIALFSSLMLWLTPTFMTQVSTTYVDIGVTFFLFLSFYLFWRTFEQSRWTYFFLSGAFLGFSGNSKYSGLLGLVPFAAFFGYLILRSRFNSQNLKAFLSFGLGFIVLGGFLFIRNWLLTGNPIFPVFSSFIGEKVGSELTHDLFYTLGPFGGGLTNGIVSFLLIPWNFTFVPRYATLQFEPQITLGEWMGPFYLLSLPFALYGFFKKDRLVRFCFFFLFFYQIGWFFMGQYVRYLLPIFPICLIAFAPGVKHFLEEHHKYKRIIAYAGGLIALFLFSILIYHFRYQYKPLLGVQNYRAYLERMERTYPVAEWANRELPPNARILSVDEFRLFYFDREAVRWIMLFRHPEYPRNKSSKEVTDFLKSIGITHILSAEYVDSGISVSQVGARREFDQILSDVSLVKKLTTIDSRNLTGGRFRYSVYELLT